MKSSLSWTGEKNGRNTLRVRYFFNLFFNICLWETEIEHEWGRGRERGRHRIPSRLQTLSCQHRARHGAQTHGPRNHDLSWSRPHNWLSHPGAPIKKFLMFTYFWDRERQSVSRGGAEREGDRIRSRLQAPSCQHRAWRGAQTHGPRDHDLSWSQPLNRMSHPGTPVVIFL